MKEAHVKQIAGLWLDNAKAILISTDASTDSNDFVIREKIKAPENHGGGSEHSMNNSKNSHHAKYFKEISAHLLPFDEVLLFGPGKSQEQLQNFLKEDAHFNNKKINIDSDEQLSDPQMIAKVREYFK